MEILLFVSGLISGFIAATVGYYKLIALYQSTIDELKTDLSDSKGIVKALQQYIEPDAGKN